MDYQDWYISRAYSILNNVYPLSFDCGLLCNAKCCGGRNNDGMLLFPGEEHLFKKSDDYIIKESPEGKILICNGHCNRNERPLACRMFPLFPYVEKDTNGYKISVLKDIRAISFCPLNDMDVSPSFKRAVRMAARNLLRDDQNAEFLYRMTNELTDFGGL